MAFMSFLFHVSLKAKLRPPTPGMMFYEVSLVFTFWGSLFKVVVLLPSHGVLFLFTVGLEHWFELTVYYCLSSSCLRTLILARMLRMNSNNWTDAGTNGQRTDDDDGTDADGTDADGRTDRGRTPTTKGRTTGRTNRGR